MPAVDLVVKSKVSNSVRARQVCSMFDVPPQKQAKLSWKGKVPIEDREWNIGLIVGPSGCGKSTIARGLFGDAVDRPLEWGAASVIDDFGSDLAVADIAAACSAVGFNTIPAWLRPFGVLSNGEKFRVELARRLLEGGDLVAVDEFTSVVDRQVAQIGSHAVQKAVRKRGSQFVAVSCHYDIIDWLQPDWVLEPATMAFSWRSVQPRPRVELEIRRVHRSMWALFAPYHYLTADLATAATCFAAFVGGRPAAFAGVLHFPHPKVRDIKRVSRLVTLPDWQGLGIAFALVDEVARAYSAVGNRLRTYPAHPALVRSFGRSPLWRKKKEAGTFQQSTGKGSTVGDLFKSRPCAVFEWCGDAMERADATRLLEGPPSAGTASPRRPGKARAPRRATRRRSKSRPA